MGVLAIVGPLLSVCAFYVYLAWLDPRHLCRARYGPLPGAENGIGVIVLLLIPSALVARRAGPNRTVVVGGRGLGCRNFVADCGGNAGDARHHVREVQLR